MNKLPDSEKLLRQLGALGALVWVAVMVLISLWLFRAEPLRAIYTVLVGILVLMAREPLRQLRGGRR